MARKITIELSDEDEKVLAYILPYPTGLDDWVKGMVRGKIDQGHTEILAGAIRFMTEGKVKKDDVASFEPAALIDAYTKHPDYKDHEARDKAEKEL